VKYIKTINERAIDVADFPDTYLADIKQGTSSFKKFKEVAAEIYQMFKDLKWQDIKFETVGSAEVAILPAALRAKLMKAHRINSAAAEEAFEQSGNAFGKTWNGETLRGGNTVHMEVEKNDGQRSHFPDGGIPDSLKGFNLGYKFYRALLQKYKFLSSNTQGTTEKDRVWTSLISPKKDRRGRLTDDDVHSILGPDYVFAMVKNIPEKKKIEHAKAFIQNNVDTDSITKKNLGIDDELMEILPDDVLINIDPKKKEEKKKELIKVRLDKFTPRGRNDYAWEIGDYIISKDDLENVFDDEPNNLKVKKVVGKDDDDYWVAIALEDVKRYERNGHAEDIITTPTKQDWVKAKLQPGDEDPSAGRLVVKGGTRSEAGERTGDPTPNMIKLVKRFMSDDNYEIWCNNGREAFIVKDEGRNKILLDARTGDRMVLTRAAFRAKHLNQVDIHTITRKTDVRPGDYVFVIDHRRFFGLIVPVHAVTPASNRQPGIYIKVEGESRPVYISNPYALYKVDLNESLNNDFRHIMMFEHFFGLD
jgi:hypothetical protein